MDTKEFYQKVGSLMDSENITVDQKKVIDEIYMRIASAETDSVYWEEKYKGNWPSDPTIHNPLDRQYKNLIYTIQKEGIAKADRTGVGSISTAGYQIKHDMSQGFPLLSIRKVPFKSVRVELEGFIKGITSKKWFQERGCKFWDEWCNPLKVPYGNDEKTKARMLAEDDLGPIYGAQWRGFCDPVLDRWSKGFGADFGTVGGKVDQLANVVKTLKTNPADRRMLVYAYNQLAVGEQALPACHDSWQVTVTGNKINLIWRQRSVDVLLGLPANIASYATLLHLLSLETGYEAGLLIGHLGDVHLYNNQLDAAKEYLSRDSFKLPQVETANFTNIFDWTYDQTKVVNYEAHPLIKVAVAV